MSEKNEGFSKSLIQRIKEELAKFSIEIPAKKIEETPVKLEDVALKDGTILSVDAMEVGSAAMFTGADGIPVAAEGSYELPDGSTVVCVAGKVTEIKPASADTQPETDMASKLSAIEKRFTDLESRLTLSKASEKSLETKLSAVQKELTETKKGVAVALEAMEVVSNMPVALSLEKQTGTPKKKERSEMTAKEIALEEHRERKALNK